jgi:hypothetical protein
MGFIAAFDNKKAPAFNKQGLLSKIIPACYLMSAPVL